jgi:hypothetical protein
MFLLRYNTPKNGLLKILNNYIVIALQILQKITSFANILYQNDRLKRRIANLHSRMVYFTHFLNPAKAAPITNAIIVSGCVTKFGILRF